jgi:hypothetical protein
MKEDRIGVAGAAVSTTNPVGWGWWVGTAVTGL